MREIFNSKSAHYKSVFRGSEIVLAFLSFLSKLVGKLKENKKKKHSFDDVFALTPPED